MTQREVVFHGIIWVQPPERLRDLPRHGPARGSIRRELETLSDPNDVRIQRYDELGPVDSRPGSEVDVVAPNHPPQVEIQSLAGAPVRRPGKEVPDSLTCRRATIHTTNVDPTRAGAEVIKRRANVFSFRAVSREKEVLDRASGVNHVTQHHEQRNEIASTNPPMAKDPDRSMASARIELAHEGRG